MVTDSALAPWQKIKVLLSHLMPSLLHNLSSDRVLKSSLLSIGKRVSFLRLTTTTTDNNATYFFYTNREVGTLAINLLFSRGRKTSISM